MHARQRHTATYTIIQALSVREEEFICTGKLANVGQTWREGGGGMVMMLLMIFRHVHATLLHPGMAKENTHRGRGGTGSGNGSRHCSNLALTTRMGLTRVFRGPANKLSWAVRNPGAIQSTNPLNRTGTRTHAVTLFRAKQTDFREERERETGGGRVCAFLY